MRIFRFMATLFFISFSTILSAQNALDIDAASQTTFSNTANPAVTTNAMAARGSTQYVILMNALGNPATINLTKSDVMIKLYDGTGKNPPCWTLEKVIYHNDPYVAGAGGRNACGMPGTSAGIVKIDIIPLTATAGKVYNDLLDVQIDAKKFYTGIIIEQATAPTFNSNGSLNASGTIKVSDMTENKNITENKVAPKN